jgi:hypothetical protein
MLDMQLKRKNPQSSFAAFDPDVIDCVALPPGQSLRFLGSL